MTVRLLSPARAAELRARPWTYPEVGQTRGDLPAGYKTFRRSVVLPAGTPLGLAAGDLLAWRVQRSAGLRVTASEARIEPGTVVELGVGPMVFAPCRVVYVIDEPARQGFAYGTLPGHPESGEEAFVLDEDDGTITFSVTAFSRPASWLARLAGPLAGLMQDAMTARYLRAFGGREEPHPGPDQRRLSTETTAWHNNCNPFGLFGVKCGDPWCSMFASWTWRMAGINTYYPYSGDFYYWGKNRGQLRSFNHVKRGDVVLYGSGPSSSQHIGVVETVHADGKITTIEGNYGNKVTRVGPFDPENPQPQHTYSNIFAIVAPINDALPTTAPPAKHHLYTFDFPVTYADAAIRLPVKTNWSMASKELHRDFNDSFPIGGAPNAFPAEGQTIPLRACVLAVCKDAPVKYYGDASGYHFDTLPGHFDGEGSTVAFRFHTDSNGWLRLEVKGWVTDPDLPDWLNKAGAYTQWAKFAAKLGDNLHTHQKCDTNGCG